MNDSTVVVGIDGGPASRSALRAAVLEARYRNGRTIALICIPLQRHQQRVRPADEAITTYDTASALLEKLITEIGEDGSPDIVREVSIEPPAHALLRHAESADLLVLGSSIEGKIARFVGGSVLDECLDAANIPVMIVPQEAGQ